MTDRSNTNGALASFVGQIESLSEEKVDVQKRIKDIYAEAKSQGYDVKVIRKIIARRKRDADEVAEEDSLIATYEEALAAAMAMLD